MTRAALERFEEAARAAPIHPFPDPISTEIRMNHIAPRPEPLIREIPFSRLALAPENVRKTPADPVAEAEMKASITVRAITRLRLFSANCAAISRPIPASADAL